MLIVLDYRKIIIYVLKLRAKTRVIALVALVLGPPLCTGMFKKLYMQEQKGIQLKRKKKVKMCYFPHHGIYFTYNSKSSKVHRYQIHISSPNATPKESAFLPF
jgi:hypothetical protein